VSGGALFFSDVGVRRDRRLHVRRGLSLAFPPSSTKEQKNSGTTGVAQKNLSCKPDSTSACRPAWLINALASTRAYRASWRMATFYFSCLSSNMKIEKINNILCEFDGVVLPLDRIELVGRNASPNQKYPFEANRGNAQRQQQILPRYCCRQLHFISC
jgi:hypothetical protein